MNFKTWKTIKLGTGLKTGDDFRKALKEAKCQIAFSDANAVLDSPSLAIAPEETFVNLVEVSVRELGFRDGATLGEVFDRAREIGLSLCPPEVGPQLRLQFLDQREGKDCLRISMEPIPRVDDDGERQGFAFVLEANDGLWLSVVESDDVSEGCDDENRFVFLQCKQ